MEIDINQKKISIGDKYQIFINGQQTHVASKELFKLLPVIDLFEIGTVKAKLKINKRFSGIKAKYDITRWDSNIIEFRTISFWKLHYQCHNGSDTYDIYGHKGRKYSIFKNNSQVAFWDKQSVTWFAGDNYKIIADKECDVDLLIAFCLIIDNFASDDREGNTVTVNYGNIGFWARKFDKNWLPKV
ncbi:MAG: hypothetical protein NTY07_00900 [Bacteroidia bacterium]|nr:hypothetical protein [Bacteroidia bacterium]